VSAEAYTPTDPEHVIAQWNTTPSALLRGLQMQQRLQPQDSNRVLQLVNQYLVQATQPGQSHLYGVAEALLKPLIENNTQDLSVLLAWVQVQQHQHRFVVAQSMLQKILVQQPDNITANVLDARLYLIQGNAASAKSACMRLLGHADLLTLSACTLEARSILGDKELSESYAQLQHIVITQGLPEDERQIWVIQILADMALRLQQPQAALEFLNQIKSKNSLSVWVQWADVNLAVQNHQSVINELTPLVSTSSQADDSLLVRLAIAEKKTASTTHWQTQVSERIALRELRDDQAHAADLAIYYLDIAPDATKALHWAERNWQQAREASDKQLLLRAQQAAGAATVTTKGGAS
jgi:predicted Zn-dependent protease